MRNLQGSSSSYQKPQELASLPDYVTGGECSLYKLIHSKKNMATLSAATNLSESIIEDVVQETINTLRSKNLIKEEFQPPKEIISGSSSSFNGKREEITSSPAAAASRNATLETRVVYDLIKNKNNKGIKIEDMIRETNLSETVIRESIKILLAKKIIRVIVIPCKGENRIMLKEYEPAKEIFGGISRYYDKLGGNFPYQQTNLYDQTAPVGFLLQPRFY